MSEERLAAIESLLGKVVRRGDELAGGQQGLATRMDELVAGQRDLVNRVDGLAVGQHGLVTRVDGLATGLRDLATRVDGLAAGHQELQVGQKELQAGQKRLETRIEEVDRHMHVLHENVLDRIAAIPTDGPSKVEVKRWIDDQGEAIGRRLDPLEAAVIRHTAEIEQLKNARG